MATPFSINHLRKLYMKKEILLARIQELGKQVNESKENHERIRIALEHATNAHNALVGRLAEAQEIYKEFEKNEGVPEEEIKNLVVE